MNPTQALIQIVNESKTDQGVIDERLLLEKLTMFLVEHDQALVRQARKQRSKEFLVLIGEDERTEDHDMIKAFGGKWRSEIADDNLKRQRNKWRAALRRKVNEQ